MAKLRDMKLDWSRIWFFAFIGALGAAWAREGFLYAFFSFLAFILISWIMEIVTLWLENKTSNK